MPATDRRVVVGVVREQEFRSASGWNQHGPTSLHVAVASDRVLVLSGILGEIEEFTAGGELVSTWARRGQGAGELFGPMGLAVGEDSVIVADVAASRLSHWTHRGQFLGEFSHEEIARINRVLGAMGDGVVVSKVLVTQDDESQTLSLLTGEGDEVARYAILPIDMNFDEETLWPRPLATLAGDGTLYASAASAYEIHAFGADGTLLRVLQVDWPRLEVSETARRTVERTRRAGRALGANVRERELLPEVPQRLPALEDLEVDGHNRLYVFPLVGSAAERFPVDIYSPEGELMVAGWLPFQGWDAQLGDHIYRIETDPDTGETIVVRYRLELNL